ncbi:hypothetical protein RND71_015766 [Anisodus tanguticus]|uniref:Uncharacterized protein n=1 Tax=Anisodus tanguticus TaxID=243964 RepID=A0AAE1S667_9SOLA|nr:hypothetical protein RND71_015766 [Anisodus tanguticus]
MPQCPMALNYGSKQVLVGFLRDGESKGYRHVKIPGRKTFRKIIRSLIFSQNAEEAKKLKVVAEKKEG